MVSKAKTNLADVSNRPFTRASLVGNSAPVAPHADTRAGRLSFSPAKAGAIARQRQAALLRFESLKEKNGTAKAAALVGSSIVTLWRWQKAFAARGMAGLMPQAPSGGRTSPFQKLRLPVSAIREIERLMAASGSAAAGWRQFASHPDCPPVLARYIQKHGTAPERLAGVARLTPVPTRCSLSADGRRLFVRLASGAVKVVGMKGGEA